MSVARICVWRGDPPWGQGRRARPGVALDRSQLHVPLLGALRAAAGSECPSGPVWAGAPGQRRVTWGHRGEAYGFLGGLWRDPARRVGLVYLMGGLGDAPPRHPAPDAAPATCPHRAPLQGRPQRGAPTGNAGR